MKPILFFLLFACGGGSLAQQSLSANIISEMEAGFNQLLTVHKTAGFAVAVVKKDKIIYAEGFGYRDIEQQLPVTANTVFPIGSCTKAFTATLIGQLVDQGKFSLDQPVTAIYPQLQFYSTQMNAQITLRDMMSHRTGLPRHDLSWSMFPSSSTDSLIKRIRYFTPLFALRTRYQYNNFMYAVQGAIAEKEFGNSWETLIREKFFIHLGMTSSTAIYPTSSKSVQAAIGYTLDSQGRFVTLTNTSMGAMAPAGAIQSNVLDMSNWLSAWINGGKFQGQQLISPAFLQQAISAQIPIGNSLPRAGVPEVFLASYGLGWSLMSYRGHYRVEHGGNLDGYSATSCFFPTDSLGIIVLSNQANSGLPGIVRNLIADKLLNLKPIDWSADNLQLTHAKEVALSTQVAKIASATIQIGFKPLLVTAYSANFHNPGYGTIHIYAHQDSLFAKLGIQRFYLKATGKDQFQLYSALPNAQALGYHASPYQITFNFNLKRDLQSLSLITEEPIQPIIFQKILDRKKKISQPALKQKTSGP